MTSFETPVEPPLTTEPAAPRAALGGAFWAMLAALGAMVIGAIGPWATALGISVSGTGGGRDGSIVIVLAVLAGIVGTLYASKRRGGLLIAAAVFGLLSAITCIVDLADITGNTSEIDGTKIQIMHAGWGIYVALVGSAVLVVTALAARFGR